MRDEELLGRVAHLGGVVDDQRARMHVLQHVRRRDVGHVEGRVLAHQHDIDAGEVERLRGPERRVVAALATHLQRPGAGDEASLAEGQVLDEVVPEHVATALRRLGEGEGRIRVDVDPLDGVHLDRDGERHRGRPRLAVGKGGARGRRRLS